jgi:Ca2+-binding RTX toxin-like protein
LLDVGFRSSCFQEKSQPTLLLVQQLTDVRSLATLLAVEFGYQYVFLASNGKDDLDLTVDNSGTDRGGIILTGNGKDVISTGSGDDLIFSGNGKDLVNAGAGEDIVFAGNGVDTVNGQDGDDVIYGENGDDVLNGDAGSDWIFGGNDNDLIHGNDDDDALFGDAGADVVHGDAGNDYIEGGDGNDNLFGDAGNDEIHGDDGDDAIAGGTDNGSFSYVAAVEGQEPVASHWEVKAGKLFEVPDPNTALGDNPDSTAKIEIEGAYLVGQNKYLTFSFEPKDPTPTGGSITIDVFTKDGAVETRVINDETFQQNQKFYFSVPFDPNIDSVVVKSGDETATLDSKNIPNVNDYFQFFEGTEGGQGTAEQWNFEAGDILAGGAGADTFNYASGDGVDQIADFLKSEGDSLHLTGFTAEQQALIEIVQRDGDSYVVLGDGAGGYVDSVAIQLTGVTDVVKADIVFG